MRGRQPVLVLSGEIDMAAASALANGLGDLVGAESTTLTLDVAQVTFVDSTGIRFLLQLLRDGRPVVLLDAPDHMQRLLGHTGVADLVRFEQSASPD